VNDWQIVKEHEIGMRREATGNSRKQAGQNLRAVQDVQSSNSEAKKRFGLCVLNYMVTSNHVHLLVKDTGANVIAESMQLIAGRTAQEYNQRKGKQGAFWEDRYHAMAIETDEHLHRCLIYMDLNMVRANEYRSPFQSFKPFKSFTGVPDVPTVPNVPVV
jgi:REP element-mobilizing transposase RayT